MNCTGTASTELLQGVLDAFNAHDLDRVMSYFADECMLQMPRGDHPWGGRFVGREAVRQALASRLTGIPDVHYGDHTHLLCGDVGITKWTLTGNTTAGARIEVLGCDFYTFSEGKIIKKDSYWKIVEPKGSLNGWHPVVEFLSKTPESAFRTEATIFGL
jgi:hypothetical protein